MPTNANAYNSRVTDESLEKRFRDTFRSQGGAELVDDLYASGVIVPVVDFTAAATGTNLAENLQTAYDFTTGSNQISNANTTVISNAGFWKVGLTFTDADLDSTSVVNVGRVYITDGISEKNVWGASNAQGTSANGGALITQDSFVVFLRAGDSLKVQVPNSFSVLDIFYRQIATVSGDLVNPSGFTSS